MVLLLCALVPLLARAQLGTDPTDHIQVITGNSMLTLAWSDTEDVLKGGITPAPLTAGRPFTVSLRVDPVSGKGEDMPLVITLRKVGEDQGTSHVVKRTNGVWVARFTPPSAGPYTLDVAFRTTRPKLVHGGLSVRPAAVPAWAWALFGLLAAVLVLSLWRARRQEVRPPSQTTQ